MRYERCPIGELPKIRGFSYNISAIAKASDFKFGTQLGFAKAHHKITRRRKGGLGAELVDLPKIWGFPFYIYTMAEASDLKFGTQLGFAKAHHKITLTGKSGCVLGLWKLPNICGSRLIFLKRPHCPLSVSGASCFLYVGKCLELLLESVQ